MSKNKFTRWIDGINYAVCLGINKRFYKYETNGVNTGFFKDLTVYPLLVARCFLLLMQILRYHFNLLNYRTAHKFASFRKRANHYLVSFVGLGYFSKEEYLPSHYERLIPKSKLIFDVIKEAKVSIVISGSNNIGRTLTCLKSIKLNLTNAIAIEIIVVDHGYSANAVRELEKIDGIKIVKAVQSANFFESLLKAMESSAAAYVCLLSNETVVLQHWLEELVKTLESDESVGLVGSKSIHPSGLIKEAGGVIFNDGTPSLCGLYGDPNYYGFNYAREVDYCSVTSVLFKRDHYHEIAAQIGKYKSTNFTFVDFCMAIRHVLCKKVFYQPLSALVHFTLETSGGNLMGKSIKAQKLTQRKTFADRWESELQNYLPMNSTDTLKGSRKYNRGRKLVIIDSYLPRFDRESGSHRLYELIKIFKGLDFHLVFIPANGEAEQPYFNLLTRNGIEVVARYAGGRKFKKDIISSSKTANYFWACRPQLNKRYGFLRNYNPAAKWFYDTVDLHYVRLEREAKLRSSRKILSKASRYKKLELSLAKTSDVTVCITAVEEQFLKNEGILNTIVVPNIHPCPASLAKTAFDQRRDLLFVGSYDHTPNVDAVLWLCNAIMPIVWELHPTMKLHIVGNNPNKEVLALASERVIVQGFVAHIDSIFNSCRLFVAPLRYGAGMKGKIGQSLSFGLPCITTDIGAEGMDLVHGQSVLIANTAEEFANRIIELYLDENKWTKIQRNALASLQNYSPNIVKEKLNVVFENLS